MPIGILFWLIAKTLYCCSSTFAHNAIVECHRRAINLEKQSTQTMRTKWRNTPNKVLSVDNSCQILNENRIYSAQFHLSVVIWFFWCDHMMLHKMIIIFCSICDSLHRNTMRSLRCDWKWWVIKTEFSCNWNANILRIWMWLTCESMNVSIHSVVCPLRLSWTRFNGRPAIHCAKQWQFTIQNKGIASKKYMPQMYEVSPREML